MRYLLKIFYNLIFDFLDTYLMVKADELIANESAIFGWVCTTPVSHVSTFLPANFGLEGGFKAHPSSVKGEEDSGEIRFDERVSHSNYVVRLARESTATTLGRRPVMATESRRPVGSCKFFRMKN
ncbi:hypothetical protein E2986_12905 [Frieseomelitta varia]|uniref:Uncharacterized protein n=1 Tax=Frieseomelitta varia TaxID=561572 RepID=A0A833VPV2_9HYME|nr:hypothetical protein E2986_12905 [Frieseomelitta varia]